MKLSERLSMLNQAYGMMYDDYETMVEAIALAKRYEDAPVAHMCGECEHTWMRHIDTDTSEQDAALASMVGSRVRIMRDTE